MELLKVTLKGETPILMHNGRLSNPLDEATKKLKALTSKKSKTDNDHAEIARAEWEGGLYIDEDGPYIPCDNLEACIKGGATVQKLGKKFGSAVTVVEDRIPLQYKGPRDADGLWKSKFYDVRGVVVSSKRIQRCRPIFKEWSAAFTVAFDPQDVDSRQVVKALVDAGRAVGLFDRRPQRGGRFGKFLVVIEA